MPINHKIFLAQFDAIKKLAERRIYILIGRCADYALEELPECPVCLYPLRTQQSEQTNQPDV